MAVKSKDAKVLWVIRLLILLLICMCICIPTCLNTFVLHINALKAQLQFSQTQVSIIASTVTISQACLLMGGIVYDKWGILPACIITLILSTLGWSGLWLTLIAPHSHTISFYSLVVFFAIAGHGRSYFDAFYLPFGVRFMPTKYRSFVLMVMSVSYDSGYFLNALIYENLYATKNGNDVKPLQQRVTTYFYRVFLVNVLTCIISTMVLPLGQKYHIQEDSNTDTKEALDQKKEIDSSGKDPMKILSSSCVEEWNSKFKSGSGKQSWQTGSGKLHLKCASAKTRPFEYTYEKQSFLNKIENKKDEHKVYNKSNNNDGDNTLSYQQNDSTLKSDLNEKHKLYSDILTARYAFLALACANGLCVTTYSTTNATLMTQSLGVSDLDFYLVTTQRLVVLGSKVIFTMLIVVLKKYTLSMQSLCVLSAFLLVFSQVIILLFGEHKTAFLIGHIVVCICHGLFITLVGNIMTLSFSLQRFGVNYGFLATSMTTFLFISQIIFGRLYDAEIPKGGGIYCYGKQCVYNFYIYTTCQASFAVLMTFGLLREEYKKHKATKQ